MVKDHDFRSQAKGIAIPYGVYDVPANRGSIFIGISYDTPAFATNCLARWYADEGRLRYPNTNEMLILADCGGSNGSQRRAWKYGLQTKLCNAFGLTVTVCHYPPGASKWNPIEHRNTMVIIFGVQAANFVMFNSYGTLATLLLGTVVTGFCYGACLGVKNMGVNYGLVFTAWGAGGVFGGLIGGLVRDLDPILPERLPDCILPLSGSGGVGFCHQQKEVCRCRRTTTARPEVVL